MNVETRTERPLVALTGATGFLGSHIADTLLDRGFRVRASVRPTSDRRWIAGKDIEIIETPIAPTADSDTDAVAAGLDAFVDGASHLIHCAGAIKAPDEEAFRRANVTSTRLLLAAARRGGGMKSFVLISSLAAVGPASPLSPVDERSPLNPISGYGRSKREAEQLLHDSSLGFRTTALRPPALYGPRDNAFLTLFRYARRGWTPWPGPVAGISMVDGRDAAAAAVLLMSDERAQGPYCIDDGHWYSHRDVAAALAAAWEHPVRSLRIPAAPVLALARVLQAVAGDRFPVLGRERMADITAPGWVCNGQKIRRELGFAAKRNLERGFRESLTFYLETGWLDAT